MMEIDEKLLPILAEVLYRNAGEDEFHRPSKKFWGVSAVSWLYTRATPVAPSSNGFANLSAR